MKLMNSKAFTLIAFLSSGVAKAMDNAGCCSNDNKSCPDKWPFDRLTTPESCTERNKYNVWLSQGPIADDSCATEGACTSNTDCCGNLVCDATSNNMIEPKCVHPVWLCASYKNEDACETRLGCDWIADEGKCQPNYDTQYYDPENDIRPQAVFEKGCCSSFGTPCPSRVQPGYSLNEEDCRARNENMVWYPNGGPDNEDCIGKWSSETCKAHTDCCGMNMCDGFAHSISDDQCRPALNLCASFDDEAFCETRSYCGWNAEDQVCLPNFDYQLYDQEAKPEFVFDRPGCCSYNHLHCGTPGLPETYDGCAANKTLVWLSGGGWEDTGSKCHRFNGSPKKCETHSDCCGNTICAPMHKNPLSLQCQPAWDVCSKKTDVDSCTVINGCQWEGNCVPSFDTTIYDSEVMDNLPNPAKILTANGGNPDFLGMCKGFVASSSGDPHFTSFDRASYDCQGSGVFTLVEAPSQLEIQGLFDDGGTSRRGTVMKGVALDYPDLPDVPKIQVNVAEYDSGTDTTYEFASSCPVHVYLDEELTSVSRGDVIRGDSYILMFTEKGHIDMQFYKNEIPTTAIRMKVRSSDTFGCSITLEVCLSLLENEMLDSTVGLFGTPNGNPDDEWTLPSGSVVSRNELSSYEFCTQHYCVEDETDSLFVYEELTHLDRYSCDAEAPEELDFSDLPPEILELCEGEFTCLFEGHMGGIQGARNILEDNKETNEIILSDNQSENSVFDILPEDDIEDIPEGNVEDIPDCTNVNNPGDNQCPEDVVLLSSKVETSYAAGTTSPITITSQDSETVSFEIINPYGIDIMAMYYQFPSINTYAEDCFGQASFATCDPISVTAQCVHGRDGNHELTTPFALVDIWFVDPTLTGGTDEIPKCCEPTDDHQSTPTVVHTYKVSCESLCPIDGENNSDISTTPTNDEFIRTDIDRISEPADPNQLRSTNRGGIQRIYAKIPNQP